MNWNILFKYMHGNCSEEEIELLQQWLQKDPANEDFFRTFVKSWDEEPANFNIHTQQEWQKFKSNHLSKEKSSAHSVNITPYSDVRQKNSYKTHITRRENPMWYVAPVMAVLLILAGFYSIKNHQDISARSTEKITYRTIATTQGQRTNLRLKDGTQIALNAESNIRIPSNFSDTSRTVYLQGEAFFSVSHNDTLPFVVIANDVYIKDLGTAFNINAYDSASTEVAVKEGVVSMARIKDGKSGRQIGTLRNNNVGIVTPDGRLSISAIDNISLFTGWTQGKLVFDDTPFSVVVKRLERWFNIEGKIADPALNNRTLTATYDNMSMNNILEVLALSLHLTYNSNQNTIVFKDKKSTQ